MYEEHEDGSFTLHMCEWYEQGRRLVGEYETLGDGSGFAVTDEWSTCSKVVVNHPLTRPDGTVMPGISRLRRFDWKVGPDEGLHADDYDSLMETLRVYQNPYLSDKVMRGMADSSGGCNT